MLSMMIIVVIDGLAILERNMMLVNDDDLD